MKFNVSWLLAQAWLVSGNGDEGDRRKLQQVMPELPRHRDINGKPVSLAYVEKNGIALQYSPAVAEQWGRGPPSGARQ